MVNINKMHIREPASVLSKDVGKPLKNHLGSREATLFTKSTEYGKFIDNDYNDYLKEEENKRALRSKFINRINSGSNSFYTASENGENRNTFNMTSDGGSRAPSEISSYNANWINPTRNTNGEDIYYDAFEYPELTRENIEAATAEVDRLLEERRQQTAAARQQMSDSLSESFRSPPSDISSLIFNSVMSNPSTRTFNSATSNGSIISSIQQPRPISSSGLMSDIASIGPQEQQADKKIKTYKNAMDKQKQIKKHKKQREIKTQEREAKRKDKKPPVRLGSQVFERKREITPPYKQQPKPKRNKNKHNQKKHHNHHHNHHHHRNAREFH